MTTQTGALPTEPTRRRLYFRLPGYCTIDRGFHKLLGNFLGTSLISSNFLHSEQFRRYRSSFLVKFLIFCEKGDRAWSGADHDSKIHSIPLLFTGSFAVHFWDHLRRGRGSFAVLYSKCAQF